jgi:hypothetical protein
VSSGNLEPVFCGNMIRTDSGYNTVSSGSILQKGVASSFRGRGTTKLGLGVAAVQGLIPPPFLYREE